MASSYGKASSLAGIHVSQDMHYKMSKKIAQLTKVIYALHTKNDEHELLLFLERQAHEEELQRLVKETQARVESYKDSLSLEREYRVKIEALQASVSEHERLHDSAMQEFEKFKNDVDLRESALKKKHGEEIGQMTESLSEIKTQFDERLTQFTELETSRSKSNLKEMKRVREQHKEEIDKLNASWTSRVNDVARELQKYQRLAEQSEDNKKLQVEEAVRREREFKNRALETTSSKWKAEVQKFKDKLARVTEEFAAERDEFETTVAEWKGKCLSCEEKLEEMRLEMTGETVDSSEVVKELEGVRAEYEAQKVVVQELKSQLVVVEERYRQQTAEMHNRAGELGRLQALCHSLEGRIAAIQSELTRSQEKSKLLEKENGHLIATQSKHSEKQHATLKTLERDLERIRQEKRDLKTQFAQELEAVQVTTEHKETEIQQEFLSQISTLKKQHSDQLMALRHEFQEREGKQTKLNERKVEEENKRWQSKIEELEEKWRRTECEWKKRIQLAEKEVERLRREVSDGERGLGTVNSEMRMLRTQLDGLRVELGLKEERVGELEALLEKRAGEMDGMRMEHRKSVDEVTRHWGVEREVVTQQMQKEWTDRLRNEMSELRLQLSRQHSQDSFQALEQLSQLKDKELETLQKEMTAQLAALQEQLDNTEKALDDAKLAAKDSERQISQLQAAQDTERLEIEKKHKQALKELEQQLLSVHQNELLQERQANSVTVQVVRDQAKKEEQQMLDEQKQELYKEMDELRLQLERDHECALEELAIGHKAELERIETVNKKAVSDVQQQVMEHQSALEQLTKQHRQEIERIESRNRECVSAIQHQLDDQKAAFNKQELLLSDRDSSISSLISEVNNLKDATRQLRHELEEKGNEVLFVRREANALLKGREDELVKEYNQELLHAAHGHAQEIYEVKKQFEEERLELEDRIIELQSKLADVQELYEKRESRPEDLEMIEELKWAVVEKEESLQRLEEEKRYIQLELINREENFNRIFKASPRVGVMDPLQGKKRKQGKQVSDRSLSPGTAARLAPLSGSPSMRRDLRRTKPLPDPFLTDRATKPAGSAAAV